MVTPTPYIARQRGELIQAEDWNNLQIRSREEIQSHDHTGGEQGAQISSRGIAAGSVTSLHIAAAEINTAHLQNNAVTAAKIAAAAITNAHVAPEATIAESKITFGAAGHNHDGTNGKKISYHNLDDVPTTFPLAVNSITSSHITAAAINTSHLQDHAVTAAKIAAAAITNVHVAPEAAIAESKITFGAAGHNHDGTNGKKISYHNLDDVPTTFPPGAHQHRGEELTIANLRIGGNLQVERSGFFTGNVGIGTPAPREALEVHGNIRLGQGGSFYALAALHNLRVIVGKVHDDGSKAWGDGFQSRRTDTGQYRVDFDEHFAGVPVVIAGCTDTNPDQKETVGCHGVSASGFDVRLWRNVGNRWEDDPFDFIALGPK